MADTNYNNNVAFDWDDEIIEDGSTRNFVLLPEGDYTFKVTKFERARFNGSDKMQPCPKANLTFEVETGKGVAVIKTSLYLNRSFEWKLSAFFRCIGQKKHGEKVKMNWSQVVGAFGKAHITEHKWTDDDGNERTSNEIDYFIDPEETKKVPETVLDESGNTPDVELPF